MSKGANNVYVLKTYSQKGRVQEIAQYAVSSDTGIFDMSTLADYDVVLQSIQLYGCDVFTDGMGYEHNGHWRLVDHCVVRTEDKFYILPLQNFPHYHLRWEELKGSITPPPQLASI